MLHRVMRAPMSFFDTTPIGRVLNRFSKDVYVIDEVLPNLMGMFFSAVLVTLGIVVVICISTPPFLVLLLPISAAFVFVQQYYIRSSRELQRYVCGLLQIARSHCAHLTCCLLLSFQTGLN
jgi:ATP-binding cassette, subfamily C (CFTR/MRP), member 1